MATIEAGRPTVAVIGGGVSGLAVAQRVTRDAPTTRVLVFERDDAVGGAARTDVVHGYTVDRGPTGWLGSATAIPEIIADLGLANELQGAGAGAEARYLYKDGGLHRLPGGLGAFLTTGLLTPGQKARVLLEPFAPPRPAGIDETVWDFAARRLGPGFADTFVASMVRGVTAGNARSTSLEALFPKMRAMEDDHGGLVRALVAKRWTARRGGAQSGGPAGPGGGLTGFRSGGMQRLADALAGAPGVEVRTGTGVVSLQRAASDGPFRLVTDDDQSFYADQVVVATPAFVAARLLDEIAQDASEPLRAIRYAGARVVALGYDRADVPRDLAGFGFLVPPGEPLRMLGCQWSSSLFPEQAPAGKVLLRVIGGGVDDPEFVTLSDDAALAVVRRELETTMGITASPEVTHQVRWNRAIPQYEPGHLERVARAGEAVHGEPGLHLVGNAYEGVGLESAVKMAHRVAGDVVARSKDRDRVVASAPVGS